MNDTRGLRRLGTITDRPLPHLVSTRCEERPEVERFAHSGDNLGQSGLGAELLALLLNLCVVLEAGEALFERNGDGDDGVTSGVLFHPLGDLGQVLVLLADVVLFAEVDEEDNGLG